MLAYEVWIVPDRRGSAQEVVGDGVISIVRNEVFHRWMNHTVIDTSGERANVCVADRDSVTRLFEHKKMSPTSLMGEEYKRIAGPKMRQRRVF